MANPALRWDKPSGGEMRTCTRPVVANPALRWGKPSGGVLQSPRGATRHGENPL